MIKKINLLIVILMGGSSIPGFAFGDSFENIVCQADTDLSAPMSSLYSKELIDLQAAVRFDRPIDSVRGCQTLKVNKTRQVAIVRRQVLIRGEESFQLFVASLANNIAYKIVHASPRVYQTKQCSSGGGTSRSCLEIDQRASLEILNIDIVQDNTLEKFKISARTRLSSGPMVQTQIENLVVNFCGYIGSSFSSHLKAPALAGFDQNCQEYSLREREIFIDQSYKMPQSLFSAQIFSQDTALEAKILPAKEIGPFRFQEQIINIENLRANTVFVGGYRYLCAELSKQRIVQDLQEKILKTGAAPYALFLTENGQGYLAKTISGRSFSTNHLQFLLDGAVGLGHFVRLSKEDVLFYPESEAPYLIQGKQECL